MFPLITPRLTLTQITEREWPFFLRLQLDPQVMQYVTMDRTEAEIRQTYNDRLVPWDKRSRHWLCLAMRDKQTGALIGVTGFERNEEDQAEVGYMLDPAYYGQGYGTESLHAICRFAFKECAIRRLTATVTVGNIGSRKVLEKTGFQLEGTLRENYLISGVWHDDWIFGLLRREFNARG
ncbi:GNAT family N-acetyltransferase [Dryocola sp. BD626]|uniref:GNAT family N-acetyltransferase n=1 Tax=Dryocola sp. BD626 TaxID=3133273 RepID=UPI003F4FB3A8